MDMYNALIAERTGSGATIQQEQQEKRIKVTSGNRKVSITRVRLLDSQGQQVETLKTMQEVSLAIEFSAGADVDEVSFGMLIKERTGMEVFGISIITDECYPDALKPVELSEILHAAAVAEPNMTKLVKELLNKI